MKKRTQGLLAGILIGTVITGGTVLAENTIKSLNANYMDIKIVVDGVLIEPKDANGVYVEPFASGGTTYLPVRAVGEAFGKEVSWDGKTATVYIGGKVDKPAKDMDLYSRSYTENTYAGNFRAYNDKGTSYVGFRLDTGVGSGYKEKIGDRQVMWASVTYPLSAMATSFKGTLLPPASGNQAHETVYTFYDESGNVLYQSPKMIHSTLPIEIQLDVTNCLSLMIEIKNTNNYGGATDLLIQNPVLTTRDY